MSKAISVLSSLHKTYFGVEIDEIELLPQSGSYRQYFRIRYNGETVLGVYNTDLQENRAYISFSKTFEEAGVNVPKIYIVSPDDTAYLVEDLGGNTLWDIAIADMRNGGTLSKKSLSLYKKSLKELIKIQTQTIEKLDLRYCYPRDAFDKQSMLWDLYYFKYMFLRIMRIPFDEQKLEDDIQKLTDTLDKVDNNYFLFRDFQSRNVMIRDDEPYFIDFQGGRKGAIYYDIASLLYDANIGLNESDRIQLLDYYYQEWNKIQSINNCEFIQLFYQFAIIRLTQALGAFGLRGLIERKPHFVECIPMAVTALFSMFENQAFDYPELAKCIKTANSIVMANLETLQDGSFTV